MLLFSACVDDGSPGTDSDPTNPDTDGRPTDTDDTDGTTDTGTPLFGVEDLSAAVHPAIGSIVDKGGIK